LILLVLWLATTTIHICPLLLSTASTTVHAFYYLFPYSDVSHHATFHPPRHIPLFFATCVISIHYSSVHEGPTPSFPHRSNCISSPQGSSDLLDPALTLVSPVSALVDRLLSPLSLSFSSSTIVVVFYNKYWLWSVDCCCNSNYWWILLSICPPLLKCIQMSPMFLF